MREMKFKRSSRTSLSKAPSAAVGDSSRFARRRTPGGWKLYGNDSALDRYSRHYSTINSRLQRCGIYTGQRRNVIRDEPRLTILRSTVLVLVPRARSSPSSVSRCLGESTPGFLYPRPIPVATPVPRDAVPICPSPHPPTKCITSLHLISWDVGRAGAIVPR